MAVDARFYPSSCEQAPQVVLNRKESRCRTLGEPSGAPTVRSRDVEELRACQPVRGPFAVRRESDGLGSAEQAESRLLLRHAREHQLVPASARA